MSSSLRKIFISLISYSKLILSSHSLHLQILDTLPDSFQSFVISASKEVKVHIMDVTSENLVFNFFLRQFYDWLPIIDV